ncbi:hypothetical protein [Actinoplanes sp. M2I2]|uniref:hypothetical protein n=1 Tax=Actinoplanes sp. M2I2 TaxID=1734444 RepID=UPI0020217DFA|nr:hypothetical protein [Actinoplanes sp. M2I2]
MIDWQLFQNEVSWFLQPGDNAEVGEPRPWTRGPIDGLPVLSALLDEATLTPVSVAEDAYELLAWGPADNRRGWLCRQPQGGVVDVAVAPVHRRFWEVCGGMVERFGEPTTWWTNQDEVLTAEATRVPAADALADYAWMWDQDGLEMAIDPADYYTAAVEANGNLTLARHDDGRLVVFAPDHSFSGVTPLADSPAYALLTIDDVPDLTSWIEVCAAAWRRD